MDRTEHFRGRLLNGDTIVLDRVEGFLRTRPKPAGANGEWTGYFEFPPEKRAVFTQGDRFRLVLIDGRSGFVNIHPTANDPMGRSLANFHGLGACRR